MKQNYFRKNNVNQVDSKRAKSGEDRDESKNTKEKMREKLLNYAKNKQKQK